MAEFVHSVAAIALFITLLMLSTTVFHATLSWNMRGQKNECKTKECVNVAADMLNWMDTTADPCNDFYQYACGGWLKNNPIPEDKSSNNQFGKTSSENEKVLKEILSSDYTNDRSAIKKAKKYYKACVNTEAISKACALPAFDLMEEFGGFPLFGTGIKDEEFKLEKYLAKTQNRIVNYYTKVSSPIINMKVSFDDKDSIRYVIILDQPILTMPTRDYYLKDDFNSSQVAYRNFLHDFINLMWKRWDQEKNSTTLDDDALTKGVAEIYQLEKDLAEILQPDDERLNTAELYNKINLEDMSSKVSSDFDWKLYVHDVMLKGGIKIGKNTDVVVYGTAYLSKMMTVLKKYGNKVLQNYVVMYNLARNIDLLSSPYRDTEAAYRKEISGTAKEGDRWKTCVSKAKTLLPMPVGALYIRSMFSEDSKDTTMDMINNILGEFKEGLDDLTWMDKSTRQAAKRKVDAMVKLIGYPDYIADEDDPALDDELKDVEMSEENFFKAQFDLYKNELRLNLQKINKPVDREQWSFGPADVDAYYAANKNSMTFPAAILQRPFFSPSRPYAVNFGSVGHAIAHELTHGFDTTGSTYDEIGNLTNWWTDFSRIHFEKAVQCIREQYSGFYYEEAEMYVNGNLTVRENTADVGGIRYAYEGYQAWRKNNKNREFDLPGLEEYTMEQLFFIGNAQNWCAADRPKMAKRRILQQPHSPGIFRVEGPFKNFEKFGEAFSCKQGKDRLYPSAEDTCRVW